MQTHSKDQTGKKNAMYRHGMFGSPIYKTWDGMIQRCHNPKSKDYKNWGGRGIKVCPQWRDFINFYKDMGDKPKGMSLGRIDNDRGYSKSNCRWETWIEQHQNRRNNKLMEYCGELKPMAYWYRKFAINKSTFEWRAAQGWGVAKIVDKYCDHDVV